MQIQKQEYDIKTLEKYMNYALKEAQKAYEKQEVPIGAVIVKDDKIIAKAHNLREIQLDATCHAEILAIKKACKKLGSWRLSDCDLYVTLEPCPMCAGAIIQSRIRKIVIGTDDPKSGAAGSVIDLFSVQDFNHRVQVEKNILQEDCSNILKKFFRELRGK